MKTYLSSSSWIATAALVLSVSWTTGCGKGAGAGEPADSAGGASAGDGDGDGISDSGFIRREGASLVDGSGKPLLLKGAAFGNNVWAGLSTPPAFHHSKEDFARLHAMGMNATRFYLNYQLFESDAAPFEYSEVGFDWIAQNVKWAKAHGVYLILNMHVPQGGFQSNADGGALWDDVANQDRFVALWKAIAERFADEPTIAGFDLLNEARTTESLDQWRDLANRTIAAIREVDKNHLVVIERLLSVGDDFSENDDENYFLVNDDNALYEFHFYQPFAYTHQYAEWVGLGDGGKYPDESLVDTSSLVWHDWSHTPVPPSVPTGDSDFAFYESQPYAIPAGVSAVQPVMLSELNSGKVIFDELIVKEYDQNGNFVRNVIEDGLESVLDFEYWQQGTTGSLVAETDCHEGGCIAIDGPDHDSNAKNSAHTFIPVPGHSYSVGGYMKGVGVPDDSRPDPRGDWTQYTRALFRLDYFTSSSGDAPTGRTKQALAAELDRLTAWGTENNVPLYLGEFGLIYHCFENDKGGLVWVGDMLDLIEERNLSFTYHSYHEWNFPIFQSDPNVVLPRDEDAVPGLVELFTEKLN